MFEIVCIYAKKTRKWGILMLDSLDIMFATKARIRDQYLASLLLILDIKFISCMICDKPLDIVKNVPKQWYHFYSGNLICQKLQKLQLLYNING